MVTLCGTAEVPVLCMVILVIWYFVTGVIGSGRVCGARRSASARQRIDNAPAAVSGAWRYHGSSAVPVVRFSFEH